jgi:hypothetical protein
MTCTRGIYTPSLISPLTQTCNHISDDRSHILISATRIAPNDTNVLAEKR